MSEAGRVVAAVVAATVTSRWKQCDSEVACTQRGAETGGEE
jgi:hypothetical protein